MIRSLILSLLSVTLATACFLAPTARGIQETTLKDFEKAHTAAIFRSQKGDWAAARGAWIRLLEEHAGAEYARPYLPEIRESLRRAAFWAKHGDVDPKDLVSGKLLNYTRTAGKIRMSYTSRQLKDFESVANFRLHPMRLNGNYTIEVEGTPRQLASLQLMLDINDGTGYLAQPGDKVPGRRQYTLHTIGRIEKGGTEVIESIDPKDRKAKSNDKAIKIKVVLGKKDIKFSYDKKQMLKVDRAEIRSGQFGLLSHGGFDSLVVTGTIEPGWLQDIVDSSVQSEMEAFEKAYKAPVALDAWEDVPVRKRTSRDLGDLSATLPYPDRYTAAEQKIIKDVRALSKARKFQEAEAAITELAGGDLSEATLEFMRVINWLSADRYVSAVASIERLSEHKKLSPAMQVTEAVLNIAVERRPRARKLLLALAEARPKDPAFHAELAQLLMLDGRLDEARARIDAGLAVVPGDAELLSLRVQVAKASQGPSWQRMQKASGESFDVATDIDKKTARIIAREADQALAHYQKMLGKLSSDSPKRKLYLFSGSKSYTNYIDGVSKSSPENTAGVFSPRLKQVLLWNQPDRDETMNVVRHEVMHSYMDEALGESPIWFAEGMAEYYAHSKLENGKWGAGQNAEDHMRALRHYGPEKLTVEQLIFMRQPEFMKNAEYCYPAAWAFVHYLHNSSFKNEDLIKRLWARLQGEVDGSTAVHEVFAPVDLEILNANFWSDLKHRL